MAESRPVPTLSSLVALVAIGRPLGVGWGGGPLMLYLSRLHRLWSRVSSALRSVDDFALPFRLDLPCGWALGLYAHVSCRRDDAPEERKLGDDVVAHPLD